MGGEINELFSLASLISVFTLTILEIILGIDNIIFVSIIVEKLPRARQEAARRVGLMLALGFRIVLLLGISWVLRLDTTLFSILAMDFSGKDLIMLSGGIFLLYKATTEIHTKLEGEGENAKDIVAKGFASTIFQIILLDLVFSVDSVITAIGLVDHVELMIVAVVIAVIVMMLSARFISDFIHHHPTIKMLALAFLLMVGVVLIADGLHQHIDKKLIYSAMAFSFGVELLNMRYRKKVKNVVELKGDMVE